MGRGGRQTQHTQPTTLPPARKKGPGCTINPGAERHKSRYSIREAEALMRGAGQAPSPHALSTHALHQSVPCVVVGGKRENKTREGGGGGGGVQSQASRPSHKLRPRAGRGWRHAGSERPPPSYACCATWNPIRAHKVVQWALGPSRSAPAAAAPQVGGVEGARLGSRGGKHVWGGLKKST